MTKPPPPKPWVTTIAMLVLLGTLTWNVIVIGPEGLPNSYILGGLLSIYIGGERVLRRKDDGDS